MKIIYILGVLGAIVVVLQGAIASLNIANPSSADYLVRALALLCIALVFKPKGDMSGENRDSESEMYKP